MPYNDTTIPTPLHGATVLIKIGSTVVAGQRDATINIKRDTIETHCKTDYPYMKKYMVSWGEWDCSFDGIWLGDALLSELSAGTAVSVTIDMNNGSTYTGDAIVTECSLSIPQDDVATFSCNLQGCGALTISNS